MPKKSKKDQPGPGGQPTKYKPEYCQQVIEWGRLGYPIHKMAALLGTYRGTLRNWAADNPEFFTALETARELAQVFEEERADKYLVENSDGPKLNTALYKFKMASRFDDYKPQKEEKSTQPIQVIINRADSTSK